MKTRFDSVKLNQLGLTKMKEIKEQGEQLARVLDSLVDDNCKVSLAMIVGMIDTDLEKVVMSAVSSLKHNPKYIKEEK